MPKVLHVVLFLLPVLVTGLVSPALAGQFKIVAKVGDFPAGATIHVCWRLVEPGNPFLAKGAFDCGSMVTAVEAPFPGGGINGDQLMSVVKKAAGDATVNEVRVRGLTVGLAPDDPSTSMMTVEAGADEFYNNYVGRDQEGRLVIFLDIEVQGK